MKHVGGFVLFGIVVLFPLAGLFVPVGAWQWGSGTATLDAVRVSLFYTGIAMVVVVLFGTPMALYVARTSPSLRLFWQALLLVSVLLPPLALGILMSLAFGPHALGALLDRFGLKMTNTPLAFVDAQILREHRLLRARRDRGTRQGAACAAMAAGGLLLGAGHVGRLPPRDLLRSRASDSAVALSLACGPRAPDRGSARFW